MIDLIGGQLAKISYNLKRIRIESANKPKHGLYQSIIYGNYSS